MIKTTIFLLLIFAFAACSSTVRYNKDRFSSNQSVKETNQKEENNEVKDSYEEVLETKMGVASYYADKYHGRPTYSGEIYDMNGLSAAHPSYRMGTIVRVTNLYNNKSVVIPINDRMPFRPDRIIDLSYGVAKLLDMVIAGIVDVKVEVFKWGEGRK